MSEKTYKTIRIEKTNGKWVVREVLGSYRQSEYPARFRTLKAAKAYIDRMAAS
jgi:hypothetical protein